ncbi:MAG: hypothetical protein M1587_01830 [Thaumarchaeota archaeon]|nr:hypothetical protein [Nitrososphaerota archaeon]
MQSDRKSNETSPAGLSSLRTSTGIGLCLNSIRIYDILFVIAVVVLFLFLYRNLLPLGEWQYDNFFEPVPNSTGSLSAILSAWNYTDTGFRQTEWGYLYQLLSGIFVPIIGVSVLQKLVDLVALPLASFTMFLFLGDLVSGRFWRYLISALYSISPAFVVDFLSGSDFAFIAGMAFPILMLSATRFIRNGSIKHLLIVALIIALVGGLAPQPIFWYFFFLIALLVSTLIAREWCSKKRILLGTLLTLSLVVALCMPLFAASFISLIESNQNLLLSGYSFASMPNHIFSFYQSFSGFRDAIVFGIVTGTFILLRPLLKGVLRRIYYDTALFVALPLTLFLMAVEMIRWVPDYYISMLAFYGFEYPSYLVDLIMWSYFIAAGALVSELVCEQSKLKSKYHGDISRIAGSLAIILLIVTLPMFATNYQSNNSYTPFSGYQFFTGISFKNYQVPSSFQAALDFLQQNQSDSRVLWLPQIPSYYEDSVSSYMPRSLSLAFRSANPESQVELSNILTAFVSNDTEYLGSILAAWAVKYVIVDLTVSNYGGTWGEGPARIVQGSFLIGNPSSYVSLLGSQKDLKLVFKDGTIAVYENLDYLPEVSVFHHLYIVDTESSITPTTYKILGMNSTNVLLISKSQIPPNLLAEYLAISSGQIDMSKPPNQMLRYNTESAITKAGPTTYDIESSSGGPLYITLSESYDSAWIASAGGQRLLHLPLPPYYTNLFFLNFTSQNVVVVYGFQAYMSFAFVAFASSWIAAIVLVSYYFRLNEKLLRKFRQLIVNTNRLV